MIVDCHPCQAAGAKSPVFVGHLQLDLVLNAKAKKKPGNNPFVPADNVDVWFTVTCFCLYRESLNNCGCCRNVFLPSFPQSDVCDKDGENQTSPQYAGGHQKCKHWRILPNTLVLKKHSITDQLWNVRNRSGILGSTSLSLDFYGAPTSLASGAQL